MSLCNEDIAVITDIVKTAVSEVINKPESVLGEKALTTLKHMTYVIDDIGLQQGGVNGVEVWRDNLRFCNALRNVRNKIGNTIVILIATAACGGIIAAVLKYIKPGS